MQIEEKILFTKRERNAILALIALLGILYIFIFSYTAEFSSPETISIDDLLVSEVESDTIKIESITKTKKIIREQIIKKENKTPRSFKRNKEKKLLLLKPFDPNTIDSLSLEKMGLKSYVVKNLINYRNKGGLFFKCDDLYKIYGLDSSSVFQLLDFCEIQKPKQAFVKKRKLEKVNLNLADTSELKSLKGIGSKFAFRIIKYRDKLGGFHNVQQLTEVYGIKPEVIDANLDRLFVSGDLQKLNINKSSSDDLAKHFYFNYKISKLIVKYRENHGPFTQVADLKKIVAIDDSLYLKIEPYCAI